MSWRQLVEPDCGGFNPLMQFSNQLMRDVAYKDEGFSQQAQNNQITDVNKRFHEEQLVNEFLERTIMPPQTFQMDALLQEMREIEAQDFQPLVVNAPRVIDEVTKNSEWTKEFFNNDNSSIEKSQIPTNKPEFWTPHMQDEIIHLQPAQTEIVRVKEFFDANENKVDNKNLTNQVIMPLHALPPPPLVNYNLPLSVASNGNQEEIITTEEIFQEVKNDSSTVLSEDWLEDFSKTSAEEARKTADYNQKFWENLQDEWKKLSKDNNSDHPWLSEFTDYYDPYKEYVFTENNPMINDENALKKGKLFLKQGDIPNAVLCFESAVKQEPENPEAWELLGVSQAENEMDPQAIAALKMCNSLQPNNGRVLMALAVSYTNEGLQSNALQNLISWLQNNPKYSSLIDNDILSSSSSSSLPSSTMIRTPDLKFVQNLYLEAVKQNQNEIDPDVQEALGVLFTLSSEYDKAADCFRAALQIRPDNAKIWNRLGASLANGNRSVEAVEAYQHALEISPGFIRARYNVGIVCMNLKAYKEAAEHLLAALNLQATSTLRSGIKQDSSTISKQMSDTIWSTLRMVISLMGKWDLQEAIDTRNLTTLNKVFNDNSEQIN